MFALRPRQGDLKILERQLPVVVGQLFGLLAVKRLLQLSDQVFLAFCQLLQRRHTRDLRLEHSAVFGRQDGQIKVFGKRGHGRNYRPCS